MCLLQVCASSSKSGKLWSLYGGDVKRAFMQGGASKERTFPLYMKPPADPVSNVVLQHYEVAMLYEFVGSVYGLSTSPYAWYLAFIERVTKIGLVVSAVDPCLMTARDAKGRLCAVLIVHVDVVAFTCESVWEGFERLRRELKGGSEWDVDDVKYLGRRIRRDLKTGEIFVTQEEFVDKMEVQEKARELTAKEMSEFRSRIIHQARLSSPGVFEPDRQTDRQGLLGGDEAREAREADVRRRSLGDADRAEGDDRRHAWGRQLRQRGGCQEPGWFARGDYVAKCFIWPGGLQRHALAVS